MFIKWYSRKATVSYVEQSMEIVRPVLSDTMYMEMRSRFRQIDNAAKTQAIIDDLVSIANKNGYSLPDLKLYGINVPSKADSVSSINRGPDKGY